MQSLPPSGNMIPSLFQPFYLCRAIQICEPAYTTLAVGLVLLDAYVFFVTVLSSVGLSSQTDSSEQNYHRLFSPTHSHCWQAYTVCDTVCHYATGPAYRSAKHTALLACSCIPALASGYYSTCYGTICCACSQGLGVPRTLMHRYRGAAAQPATVTANRLAGCSAAVG
jgi:hypothetical protein